jgi:hypothetical protein
MVETARCGRRGDTSQRDVPTPLISCPNRTTAAPRDTEADHRRSRPKRHDHSRRCDIAGECRDRRRMLPCEWKLRPLQASLRRTSWNRNLRKRLSLRLLLFRKHESSLRLGTAGTAPSAHVLGCIPPFRNVSGSVCNDNDRRG